LSVYRRPSQVRRGAFTRSPLRKSSSIELPRKHTSVATSQKIASPAEKPSSGSASPVTSARKRSSVDKTTLRSSRNKISASDSVTGKSIDHVSAKKSATEPQVAGRNSSNSKQKIASGQSHHSAVLDPSVSSSHKTSNSLTNAGRVGANKSAALKTADDGKDHSDLKPTDKEFQLKGKAPEKESFSKVTSAHQKASEKHCISEHQDSRPASRLSVYVLQQS